MRTQAETRSFSREERTESWQQTGLGGRPAPPARAECGVVGPYGRAPECWLPSFGAPGTGAEGRMWTGVAESPLVETSSPDEASTPASVAAAASATTTMTVTNHRG